MYSSIFFFQAEDGIRDAQESRGLGDVYKRQTLIGFKNLFEPQAKLKIASKGLKRAKNCLLYTSDAADE